jgi:hypothetical protein
MLAFVSECRHDSAQRFDPNMCNVFKVVNSASQLKIGEMRLNYICNIYVSLSAPSMEQSPS